MHVRALACVRAVHPDKALLQMILEAGADPAARNKRRDLPEDAASNDELALRRWANGYHEFDAERQALLSMGGTWRRFVRASKV